MTAQERDFLRAHGPLKVMLGATGAPLNFNGSDERTRGIHIDILTLMTVRLGVEFETSYAGSVREMEARLQRGEVDVIGGLAEAPGREQYAFSRSYYEARIGFWTNDRHPDVDEPADLSGLRVATAGPAFLERLQNQFPGLDVVLVDNPRVGALMLANHSIDALYAGFGAVGFYARDLGLTNLRPIGEPDQIVSTHWAALSSNTMVAGLLQKAMGTISDQELHAIYQKWVGLSPEPAQASVPFYRSEEFHATLGIAALVVAGLGVAALLLRVQVHHRTRQLQTSERRLAARTRELEAALHEVDSFNYSVSHDLRTPLRSITGFIQLLRRSRTPPTAAQTEHYLAIVEQEALRMGRILEALLELSRTTRGTLARAPVDVSSIANELLSEYTRREPRRAVQWNVQSNIRVFADPTMTRLALENLLDNAWKFTTKQPNAEIEVGQLPDGTVFVRDNGVGFDARSHAFFLPFRRFHGPGEFEGTGVGLATVQRIMKRHDGRIWAESEPGQGATFYLSFPDVPTDQPGVGVKTADTAWAARRDPWTSMPARWPRAP